jgi:dihydrolipoamide dehydrogenase
MEKFDVAIIGSGPGGYVAAIRCAQLGMKTALIEKYSTLGGTCLNVGCIPSKALLDSSEHFHNAMHTFKEHGIDINEPKVNIKQMIERKRGVVKMTCDGINFLMKKNKITVLTGHGSFINKNTIEIDNEGKKTQIETAKTIIATGSKPSSLPFIQIDKKRIITSTEALELTEVPKHLIVIGGGVIGLELGSVYARLGSKVSVVEYMDRLIPGMDASLGKELQRVLKKNLGFEFFMKHKVTGVSAKGKEAVVNVEKGEGEKLEIKGDYVLVSVGRRPYTDNLGLDKAGVKLEDKGGRIAVDDHLQTNVEGIYAIGDVVKGPMLAHKAEEEGVFVAEVIAGQKPHMNYNLIPGVVYTWPEIAAVGLTEEQLKEQGKKYKTGNFPFKASGRARASMDTDGFVKVLSDEATDEILGVHMIGPRAADMIAEAVVAMEFRASAEDIARICHAHPTFTESFKEACLDATAKRALHI